MTSAYILIAAMLLLGGLIAALGDRLGSKVGKARLRLFSLRPRQTAIVVTVLTGTLIAASTLGILFALSESLREGVFKLDDILKKRREVQKELDRVSDEKKKVEKELSAAKAERAKAQRLLASFNQKFQQAKAQLKTVSNQATALRSDIKTLLSERQQLIQQRSQLGQQVSHLGQQISQLQAQVQTRDREVKKQEQKIVVQNKILKQSQTRLQQLENQQSVLQAEIDRRDNLIGELDTAIAAKDKSLNQRESQLKELETQLAYLKREVDVLEQYYETYQELRERKIAIVRGQVLSFAAVRILEPNAALEVIDQLLSQANRAVIEATRTGNNNSNERVVKITKAQVQQLINQLQDGQDYVVRIISAGNYVQGEKQVRVFADVALNQEIFNQGEVLATVSLDVDDRDEENMQQRLDLLLSASQFRARRAGILGNIQVEDGRIKTLLDFIEKLNEAKEPLEEIKAVVSNPTSTAGPLKLHLVAVRNGKVIFST